MKPWTKHRHMNLANISDYRKQFLLPTAQMLRVYLLCAKCWKSIIERKRAYWSLWLGGKGDRDRSNTWLGEEFSRSEK